MKVEGNLNSILSNYGFYVKLKSDDRRVGELDFRKNYMQSLIIEDFESVREQINKIDSLEKRKEKEKEKDLQLEKQNSEIEIQNNQGIESGEELENENIKLENQNEFDFNEGDLLEIESEELETENSSSSSLEFLNAVREIQNNSKHEKLNEIEEVHGIFIDEWKPISNIEDNISNEDYAEEEISEEYYEEISEETATEDIYKESDIYVEHGVFIDELELVDFPKDFVEKEIPDIDNDEEGIINLDSNEEFINDREIDNILDDLLNSIEDEPKNSAINTESVEQQKEEKQEVIVVPTNVRDFIKANQGSSMSYVLQYYSKKDISKAINLGRIYVKGGKLYI